jgi:peptidoglycan/xylan/chitin deacetylase (PgdA/CDA1 family)
LELALAQEGIAYRTVRDPHRLAFRSGRFVLFDGRRTAESAVLAKLSPEHVAIDVDALRRGEPVDPFRALVDHRAGQARWEVGGYELTERISRHAKAAIRARLLARLRDAVVGSGGLWARLGAFPFPFRSAFNFRADLDERYVEDYARFARARHRLADCCTHFVSTHAYGDVPLVLQDLLRFDTQSHGHYHFVYRDPEANFRNLSRADAILRESGFDPVGYAAPHGRWNEGLDDAIEAQGYGYSSDFQVGYDDLPFFPWRADAGRFSRVLQVPVHPISEGLFFDAGATRGRVVADHLVRVVRAKIDAGEPAFVYGHPERRLGRHPEVLTALADAISDQPLVWRVTLTEFAQWWRWRAGMKWSVVAKGDQRYEVQFDDWGVDFPLALELVRGTHVSSLPLSGPVTPLRLGELAYERREHGGEVPTPTFMSRPPSLRSAVRHAIDWETVTPLDELPAHTLADRVKKGLRWWRHSRCEEEVPQ